MHITHVLPLMNLGKQETDNQIELLIMCIEFILTEDIYCHQTEIIEPI